MGLMHGEARFSDIGRCYWDREPNPRLTPSLLQHKIWRCCWKQSLTFRPLYDSAAGSRASPLDPSSLGRGVGAW